MKSAVDCAFFIRPCRGERVSGDLIVVEERGDHVFLALIDALGHGPSAHAIAEVVKRAPSLDSKRVILVNLSGRGDKDVESVIAYDRQQAGDRDESGGHPAETWQRVVWGGPS